MKKMMLLIFMLLIIINAVFSYDKMDFLYETSLRCLWPGLEDQKQSWFINTGLGLHHAIVPKILIPGLYADAGLGVGWFALFSADNREARKFEKEQLALNLGFRIYNKSQIGLVNINLFAGYVFLFGQANESAIRHSPILGSSVTIHFLGLEYAYYFPTRQSNNNTYQHISLVFHITE